MKLFTFILAFSMFYSTVVPCHAGEHDHGETCTHHEHEHDNPSDNDENNQLLLLPSSVQLSVASIAAAEPVAFES